MGWSVGGMARPTPFCPEPASRERDALETWWELAPRGCGSVLSRGVMAIRDSVGWLGRVRGCPWLDREVMVRGASGQGVGAVSRWLAPRSGPLVLAHEPLVSNRNPPARPRWRRRALGNVWVSLPRSLEGGLG